MSRFYEVLRQAGQHLSDELRGPVPEGLASAEESKLPVSESSTGQVTAESLLSNSSSEEVSANVPKELEFSSAAYRKNGDLGVAVRVAPGAGSLILPNTLDFAVIDRYRLLRMNILNQCRANKFTSLLVTSPGSREGKTVTVWNLAWTLATQSKLKILVVEGDLLRGSLEQMIGIGPRPGLSDLIDGSATLEDVLIRAEQASVSFILRGRPRTLIPGLLDSPRVPMLLQQMKERFDLVLVDSPPVNVATDAQLLAAGCDAVLLVARAYATSYRALAKAQQALQQYRVIGTILNGCTQRVSSKYGSYYMNR